MVCCSSFAAACDTLVYKASELTSYYAKPGVRPVRIHPKLRTLQRPGYSHALNKTPDVRTLYNTCQT